MGRFEKGDDERLSELLRDPPPEIADEAAVAVDAEQGGDASDAAAGAAVEEIMNWVEVNCHAGAEGADGKRRYIAPPLDADVAGLVFCSASTPPPFPSNETAGVVLYGEADRSDPYDGPMVGVFWNEEDQAGHGGDGDQQPMAVRGTAGVSAPITVFQQTILDELGTVIAWTEDGLAVGLYGRFWTKGQTDQLVELANELDYVDGRFRLPDHALPDGYEQVFSGSPDSMSLVISATADYEVRYQGKDGTAGLLTLTGSRLSAEEFESFRFLALALRHEPVGDRDAIVGSAWSDDGGPAVVTWREPDGLVVRLVGLGVDLDQVLAVANQARELGRAAWVELVEAADDCNQETP